MPNINTFGEMIERGIETKAIIFEFCSWTKKESFGKNDDVICGARLYKAFACRTHNKQKVFFPFRVGWICSQQTHNQIHALECRRWKCVNAFTFDVVSDEEANEKRIRLSAETFDDDFYYTIRAIDTCPVKRCWEFYDSIALENNFSVFGSN